ncbi:MAG: TadE/TadG family type IV pilus assembly protein [bacterium]|nr:TadE/TadG family type IV pilus assembly protein [bacterium]MDD3805437.1 TadE/TadG family type IV pilus assembly protein [bacterium]MDD4557704.1 TadE/TadG family type IV pilus assembly protein [bacterium]
MKRNKGQSLVEMALIMPLFLLLIMGLLQFSIILRSKLVLEHAVREGGRLAAVMALEADSDDKIKQTVINAAGTLDPILRKMDISVSPSELETGRMSGYPITVIVNYSLPLQIPVINSIINHCLLRSRVVMRIE